MISGSRQSGGMFHGEVVHGRGREQLAIRHAAEDAKSDEKGTAGVGGGSRTDTAVGECKKEMVDRVARYRFD